jgi:hypothetical protein
MHFGKISDDHEQPVLEFFSAFGPGTCSICNQPEKTKGEQHQGQLTRPIDLKQPALAEASAKCIILKAAAVLI